MALVLPKISKLIFENNGNEIWQHFGDAPSLDNIQIASITPFRIECAGVNFILTSDKSDPNIGTNEYALLTSKKPTRADFNAGRIKIKQWLKHPLFQNKTPQDVVDTWGDNFKFIKLKFRT